MHGTMFIVTTNGELKELPINLGQFLGREIVYTGGGYFRVIPYAILQRMTKRAPYVMSYFHPSDFDPEQPHMPQLSLMRQFKNRVALRGSYAKFKKYISDFDFVSIPDAASHIDWSNCQKVDITTL